jgi:cell filamentation protein, protein adenylyltransferase
MKDFRAGSRVPRGGFSTFEPAPLARQWRLDDMEIINLLGQADRDLGRLDMFSEHIPDVDLFIRMHVLKEATQSTRIEGTQTNMDEALRPRSDISADRRDDWEEVQNYVAAMNEAIKALADLPLSSRLIRETHATLMRGVRGRDKLPGEFRRSQNWIGGATLKDATFVPPAHDSVPDLMADLERFIHDDRHPFPELLKAAIVHYQFETIHPFLDGNGRAGRLLITLYLVSKGVLKRPVLYLSDFFERHRSHYYDNLMRVRTHDDLAQWLRFFLVGVVETAQGGIATLDAILKLQKRVEAQAEKLGSRAANAHKVLHALFKNPVVDAAKVARIAGISAAPAYKLVDDLERLGILREVTGGRRGRSYVFDSYVKLFR